MGGGGIIRRTTERGETLSDHGEQEESSSMYQESTNLRFDLEYPKSSTTSPPLIIIFSTIIIIFVSGSIISSSSSSSSASSRSISLVSLVLGARFASKLIVNWSLIMGIMICRS